MSLPSKQRKKSAKTVASKVSGAKKFRSSKAVSFTSGKNGAASFAINSKLYPIEVIYQTAYVFTRDAYVSLDGDPAKIIKVNLHWKNRSENASKNIHGKFVNELLNQTIRGMVNLQNAKVKEQIVAKALVSASGNTEFDDILSDLGEVEDSDLDAELDDISKKLK